MINKEKVLQIAKERTEKETSQAMQGFVHNMNSLHSRAADQIPFSSVNVGTDTSESGRLITKLLLERMNDGGGEGETFIYPIIIFHVLEGINYYPNDPNYDLYKLAMKSSSTRIYPNYNFADSPFQFQYIRNKQGKLLWKAKENYYIKLGLLNKEEQEQLDILNRIRAIQKVERNQRKQNKEYFNVAQWFEGTDTDALLNKAHKLGAQYPMEIDALAAGIDDRTLAPRMGCRTLTIADNLAKFGPNEDTDETYTYDRAALPPFAYTAGRGNFNFVTMNLPRFAIQAVNDVMGKKYYTKRTKEQQQKIISGFYQRLLKYMLYAKNILQLRAQIIGEKPKINFFFHLEQDLIRGSRELKDTDKTHDIWAHFSKSIGYIGLYETMQLLYHTDQIKDPHHAQEIIKFMRHTVDNLSNGYYILPTSEGLKNPQWHKNIFNTQETTFSKRKPIKSQWDIQNQVYNTNDQPIYLKDNQKLQKNNWSLFATPAEGACMAFRNADYKDYGKIKNITDKDYYTNSNHIDVRNKTNIHTKIQTEAPYHTLCNAGNIFYIETDGAISKNLNAYEEILQEMHDAELGYCGVNVPLDQCMVCRHRGEIPEGEPCPVCGNNSEDNILRLRRITGYLSSPTKTVNTDTGKVVMHQGANAGKKAEIAARVKHAR